MNYFQQYQPPPGPPPDYMIGRPPPQYPAPPVQQLPYQQPLQQPAPYNHNPRIIQHEQCDGPDGYHPRFGFTRLGPRFHIWNVMTSGGTSCLEMGSHDRGTVAYSVKMFSASRLKIKPNAWESSTTPICTIESEHIFSSKSTITFDGYQSKLKEVSKFNEGATWPFEVEVNGRRETWQWRKRPNNSSNMLKQIKGSLSDNKFGSWDLTYAGSSSRSGGPPAATFEAAGGSTFKKNSSLGAFQFHGPAANGALGDVFANVSIAILLRIISQHYISKIASAVGSAAG